MPFALDVLDRYKCNALLHNNMLHQFIMLSSFGFGNNKEQCCSVIIEICEGYNITQ
jgi:hypothetical protein